MSSDLTRRGFLSGITAMVPVAAGLVACHRTASEQPSAASSRGVSRRFAPNPGAAPTAIPTRYAQERGCLATEPNIQGPYYRAGAPFRDNLRDAATVGIPLVLTGRVLSLDCRSALENALVDVWQADGMGHYDNDGSGPSRDSEFRLRGRLTTGRDGNFRVDTVIPGHYLNGSAYRPAHVHVKVTAPNHAALTTQLYFPGDPYNEIDPFLRESLIVDLAAGPSGAEANYDFVLSPLGL